MGNSFLDKPITDKKITQEQSQEFRFTICEMQGWRRFMEDAYIAKIKIQGFQQISIFGVFDGHGGAQVSKFIANHFIENLVKRKALGQGRIGQALTETYIQTQLQLKTKDGIKECIKYKQDYTKAKVTQAQLESGATATVVVITKDKIICANAGDSRAALLSKDVIPLSFDHKPQNPIEKQRIEKAGAKIIQGRVNGLNLTRSIGDFAHKVTPGVQFNKQPITCMPDIIEVNRSKDDKMILLGCDGIWQKYGDDHKKLTMQMYNSLKQKTPIDTLKDFFDKNLGQNINEGPYGRDNMTAIIIQFLGNKQK